MIRDMFNGVISEYDDNKLFLEKVTKRFQEMKEQILRSEGYDRKRKVVMDHRMNLDKAFYFIPQIDVPVTLQQSSDEGEGEGEDYDSESFQGHERIEDDEFINDNIPMV
jgi:hypothetical protein